MTKHHIAATLSATALLVASTAASAHSSFSYTPGNGFDGIDNVSVTAFTTQNGTFTVTPLIGAKTTTAAGLGIDIGRLADAGTNLDVSVDLSKENILCNVFSLLGGCTPSGSLVNVDLGLGAVLFEFSEQVALASIDLVALGLDVSLLGEADGTDVGVVALDANADVTKLSEDSLLDVLLDATLTKGTTELVDATIGAEVLSLNFGGPQVFASKFLVTSGVGLSLGGDSLLAANANADIVVGLKGLKQSNAVPEPTTIALMGLGLLGAGAGRRRLRARA